MKTNDVILRVIVRFVSFLILAFATHLFFAGHNEPGGGFIGGLATAAALVLIALAYDIKTLRAMLPIDYRLVTGAGLLIAALTGAGSFIFGQPFLSHTFTHAHLPLLGDAELATAVLFDLGVYLTVVGVTMTIILTIGEDR